MQTPCSTLQSLTRALPALGVALLLAAPASAQVNYVRELVGTTGVGTSSADALLTSTQTPGASAEQPFLTVDAYYVVNGATGVVEKGGYPLIARGTTQTIAAFAGSGTPGPPVTFVGAENDLITIDANFDITYTPIPLLSIQASNYRSLALAAPDASFVSLIADDVHYMVKLSDGVGTATTLMSNMDVDAASAFYQSYGLDGNLYVLDYGNDRMASFDPDNAFAPVGSFDLNTSVTTANQQFAIGINGSFYLADGLGGGTYYDAAGNYKGLFAPPEGTLGDAYIGESYVSTDSAGHVYVFDSATGFHQYQDVAVVPEPTTFALVITGLFGTFLRRRRSARI